MRQAIAEKVREKPGIHLRELKRELDCSSSTLNYHLRDLDTRERKLNGYRRIYPSEVSERLELPLAALNHPVRGKILYYVEEKNSGPAELAENLDVSRSTVSSHINRLENDGILEVKEEGRRKDLSTTQNTVEAFNEYASRLIDVASDGFIEMWE